MNLVAKLVVPALKTIYRAKDAEAGLEALAEFNLIGFYDQHELAYLNLLLLSKER